ncbi:hypothetical protein GCM10009733_052000 [Nonomuraea maheshkhaliensis]|uniref:Uncharacterized protein n=1 Tax=Nonomuraea maheshkhaliensis TaxID=419590 RepID=A0ABP4RFL7_9ACTN
MVDELVEGQGLGFLGLGDIGPGRRRGWGVTLEGSGRGSQVEVGSCKAGTVRVQDWGPGLGSRTGVQGGWTVLVGGAGGRCWGWGEGGGRTGADERAIRTGTGVEGG